MYTNEPLTKDFILRYISEEEILEYYTGLTVLLDKEYRNPFRPDENAGCKFYYNKKDRKIKFIDFSMGYNWDAFDVAAIATHSKTFMQTLDNIANDFKITNSGIISRTPIYRYDRNSLDENEATEIRINRQQFNEHDLSFWRGFGISKDTLVRYRVAPIAKLWIRKNSPLYKLVYIYKNHDIGFVYHFGAYRYKCYFPFREKGRKFIQTHGIKLQGWWQLPEEGDLCVITSSLKDVMFLSELGYHAVAPESETAQLPVRGIDILKERFTNLITLFNNDEAGIRCAARNEKDFGIPYTYIPQGEPKDPTDFYNQYGLQDSIDMLNNLLK